jgi:hypothetical protein
MARVNPIQKQIKPTNMTNTQTQQKEFTYFIDQKIELWTRSTKHIKADTLEQADQIIQDQIKDGIIYEDLDEYEYLYDTHKDLDIIEILNEQGNLIK